MKRIMMMTALAGTMAVGLAPAAMAENYGSAGQGAQRSMSAINASAGANSAQISDVQESLRDKGYTVSVDGLWGPQTANALSRFQSDNNLSVTGTLNNETLAQLNVDANAGAGLQTQSNTGATNPGSTDDTPETMNDGMGTDSNSRSLDQSDGMGVDGSAATGSDNMND